MKFQLQSNRIIGKDWLRYRPYREATAVDNYYILLCNRVYKIIQNSAVGRYLNDLKAEKSLVCLLVSYFEDVINETKLFSTFTKQHEKMYGKKLPFYALSNDYYDDEINKEDILFLIWYHISVNNYDSLFDPCFAEDKESITDAVLQIYKLFERDFEEAPVNERLQAFLHLPAGSDVLTVREKLTWIANKSLLWQSEYDIFMTKILDKYMENGIVVLNDEQDQKIIYDRQIEFIFNEYLPLLTMRPNEYFAELIGENHSEYQFIKNISKRIFGSFLLQKIEKNGYLLEHLTSKKQIFLSNEFTSLDGISLSENKLVFSLGLVRWKDDVWQQQGVCMINTLDDLKGIDDSFPHIFDDENLKKEIVENLEKAFLEISGNKRLMYVRGKREYAELLLQVYRKYTTLINTSITEKALYEEYKGFIEMTEKQVPFDEQEPICVYFNPIAGIESYREDVVLCLKDEANPYYKCQGFDICDLVMSASISTEFINHIIQNDLINLELVGFEDIDMMDIILDNLDFWVRFYRKEKYFSKPEVSIQS